LFSITQQAGNGCQGLLDSVFGFLARRTDFFYEMEPGDKMGFAPGVAESMVLYFNLWLTCYLGIPVFQEVLRLALQEVPS
jgi:hypothetical protein